MAGHTRSDRSLLGALCGVAMLVLNDKQWLGMFRDRRQTLGGWGWVAEE